MASKNFIKLRIHRQMTDFGRVVEVAKLGFTFEKNILKINSANFNIECVRISAIF